MKANDLLGDRYRLLAPLGQGGTAVVWQAHDELLNRDVAVKLLSTRAADEPALVNRLRTEAQAAAQLHHPHVVTVYDFGEPSRSDGRPAPYVVLELVTGRPLSEALRNGPLPWRDAVRICGQVAAGLAAAHARGIVHRDLKPANVMLTSDGAKLVDFGISATIGEADLSPDGELLCTPAYLAPERLENGPVRAACDVYGLGLLLYKLLTGDLPWRCDGVTELVAAHRQVAPAPLPPLPGLPTEVAKLLQRCLAKRPEDRPSSGEAAQVLASEAGMAPVVPLAPPPLPDPSMATEANPITVELSATIRQPVASARPARHRPTPHRPTQHRSTRRRPTFTLAAAVTMLASVALGALLWPDDTSSGPGATAPAEAACEVQYALRADSDGEFVAGVTLTNTGTEPIMAWRLDFAFPADQRVVSTTANVWHQSGQSVAIEGAGPQAILPPGESMTVDFEGSYREANPLPTAFYVNGIDCTHVLTEAPGETVAEPAQTWSDEPAQSPVPRRGPPGDDGDHPSAGSGNQDNARPGHRSGNTNGPGSGNGPGSSNGDRQGQDRR